MKLKQLLTASGTLLALLGIGFVAHRLYILSADQQLLSPKVLGTLVVGALIYAAAMVLLAGAWRQILHFLSIFPERGWLLRSYGDYQIAKYVPGNIANILGRQVSAAQEGFNMKTIATSTALELGGMLACGGLFWLMLILVKLGWSASTILVTTTIGIVLVGSALSALRASQLVLALAMQLGFLAISGFVFSGVLMATIEIPLEWNLAMILSVVATFNAAWLVGMVTPGAPAGVGIRDALLLSWISAQFPFSTQVAAAIVISRITTVLGDGLFWIAVRMLTLRQRAGR